jgi:dienelactone hydrolase
MIVTENLVYDGPGGPFEGTISWDDAIDGQRPGVLVSHAWGGQSAFDTEKAEALAGLGYVGFAIDNYGQGKRASTPEECSALMNELTSDRANVLARMTNSWEQLKSHPKVDPSRTGAIGFCMGGKCVLDLARSGADLGGVASFHGVYDPPGLPVSGPIKAAVLVLHGWEDPLAPPSATVELAKELTARKADWQIHAFGHTSHAFTNPAAQSPNSGLQYHKRSSDRAWRMMDDFLGEVLT